MTPHGSETGAKDRSRDAGVLVMGRLLATLSEALLPLVIIRLLGKADVGVLTSVLLVYTTIALILANGFPATLMYHLPGRPAQERRAVTVMVCRILFICALLASALIAASSWLTFLPEHAANSGSGGQAAALVEGGFRYLFLLAAFPLGDLPARVLPSLLVIENRTDSAARFNVIKSIGNALFVLIPAALGYGIHAVLISYSIFGLLQGGALLYFMRDIYRGTERVASPVSLREIVRFAVPLGMTDIVSMLNGRMDRYVISLAYPITVFAEYQAGAFQIPIISAVAVSVGMVYTPLQTQLLAAGKAREAIDVWRASIRKVALVVLPFSAVFVVAAEEIMELLFTKSYARAASVFRCYALLTMGRVASFGSVLVAAGKPNLLFRSAFLSLAANFALSVPCLYIFGFSGPAIGTLLAFVPMVVVYCYFIAAACELRFREIFPLTDYLRVVAIGGIAAIPAVAFKLSVHGTPALMVTGVAVLLLGAFGVVGTLTKQITAEDWRFVASWLRFGGKAKN